jgi:hypothetical protein
VTPTLWHNDTQKTKRSNGKIRNAKEQQNNLAASKHTMPNEKS